MEPPVLDAAILSDICRKGEFPADAIAIRYQTVRPYANVPRPSTIPENNLERAIPTAGSITCQAKPHFQD
jgi:hypothetical protein